MGVEGVEGAEEDERAAMYILLDGRDTMGTGYMALWGFRAKCKRVNKVNGLKTVKGGQDEREEKFE